MDVESENAQHERVQKLWRSLHTGPIVPLDLAALKNGLRKIDHPLANADELLKEVMKAVDTNHDGKIEFQEFLTFVEHAERELWGLFQTIDRDHNGKLDKSELQMAFAKAGVVIDNVKLARFFDRIDANHDEEITFDEWRDFLVFLPVHTPNLHKMLSYFSSTLTVSAEGDVHVVEGHTQGLGTQTFVVKCFLGALLRIVSHGTSRKPSSVRPSAFEPDEKPHRSRPHTDLTDITTFPWDPGKRPATPTEQEDPEIAARPLETENAHGLTAILHPGYFLAGGLAGAISRTSTAPLDRLKVYLIAQTSVKKEAIDSIKSGSILQAFRQGLRPLVDAMASLWRIGGIRSLFAGNGLNVVKVMPESAIKFGSYEAVKRFVARFEGHNNPNALRPGSQFFCAGMGGMVAQFAIYPLDTLKFRMQCETVEGGLQGNKLIAETAKKLFRGGGVLAYYRGLGMGLIGMFPYSAIDLTIYEYLKRLATTRRAQLRGCPEREAQPGGLLTGAIGAVSSSIGATAVYPLNLLRTRLQSQGTAIHPPTYSGWRDCLARTVKGEGAKGLYRGLTPNLTKVIPSMSISYMTYEASKQVMGLR